MSTSWFRIRSRRRRDEFGQCPSIPSFDHNCWKSYKLRVVVFINIVYSKSREFLHNLAPRLRFIRNRWSCPPDVYPRPDATVPKQVDENEGQAYQAQYVLR
jgi:hypothetical protein